MSLIGPQIVTQSELSQRIAYDGSGNPEYIGYGAPGLAESSVGWQIQKLTWSVGGDLESATYPSGDNSYNYVWDDKATYTYA